MADYELDPLDPQDPEYEYAHKSAAEAAGYYGTGSTTPPKDHGGIVALVLILVISFSSLLSALSLLNINIVAETETEPSVPLIFSAIEGTLPSSLEEPDSTDAVPEATLKPLRPGSTSLQIIQSPASVDNVPQETAISWQEIYEDMIPSVVSITGSDGMSVSSGTGVIMDTSGYIITNAHVVEDALEIQVLLTDGRTFPAQSIGLDVISDLAVLQIEATGLTAAQFGDSSALRVGDEVVAIGDPLGTQLRGTMTDGIISGINRDLVINGRTMSLLQTTAALNSGNSGGPLVNCYGQVIGINTMKIGDYASYSGVEGLGFAIPMSTVKTVVEELINTGYVSGRPSIGLTGQMVSSFAQYYYRIPAGFLIDEVEPDSDAAAQGLEQGDILLYLNGSRITSTDMVEEIVYSCEVGQQITAVIYRGGQEYALTLTVGEDKGS